MSFVRTAAALTLAFATTMAACTPEKPPATVDSAAEIKQAADLATTAVEAANALTGSVDDATLERYVGAYIKLTALQIQTQKQLDEAGETMQIVEIQRARSDAQVMSQAILSEAGFTEKEYLDLRHRVKLDPQLNARGEALFNRFMEAAKPQK